MRPLSRAVIYAPDGCFDDLFFTACATVGQDAATGAALTAGGRQRKSS